MLLLNLFGFIAWFRTINPERIDYQLIMALFSFQNVKKFMKSPNYEMLCPFLFCDKAWVFALQMKISSLMGSVTYILW